MLFHSEGTTSRHPGTIHQRRDSFGFVEKLDDQSHPPQRQTLSPSGQAPAFCGTPPALSFDVLDLRSFPSLHTLDATFLFKQRGSGYASLLPSLDPLSPLMTNTSGRRVRPSVQAETDPTDQVNLFPLPPP